MKSALAAALFSSASPTLAQIPSALYDTFYPPNINSTTWITNASEGTYGGVYQSGTYYPDTTAAYGTYDYCFMPHPRAQEYELPGPVKNGSVKAELVYLNYMQRHQRRTAYNILPGGEDVTYYCDNVEPFLYYGPGPDSPDQQQPMRVFAQTYTDPMNPFDGTYATGSCQYPQLTIGGLLDGYQHGKDLWGVYGEKLGFLPRWGPDSSTYFRSSESPLTQGSAGGVLRGIWPSYTLPVPLHQQATAIDTVNEGFSCNLRNTILSDLESTPEWNAHIEATAPLRAALSGYTQNENAWTSTFDHLSDNFQARRCNGYPLPCPVNASEGSACVTQAQADEVWRASDWEWNYWWRNNPNASVYIQTVEGLFIGEIISGFRAVQNGSSAIKYRHDFIHDGDIGPIAGALGISALRWPAMGSNIAFEIWKEMGSEHLYARVLYSGQPMKTIRGMLDWLPLDELIDILAPYVPDDIIALCNS
ncbi:hypothetical protein M433DRAFT_75919 [Acidomyces richmondensis BFW]|nr:MAG: hypothetical protein FE78DRAFT_29286 [Acidomyces sp. 'richmondensis']KYG41416.1 hypothetical protein M433DRAFT_75919 [Acidomyces richmondensis BFW]